MSARMPARASLTCTSTCSADGRCPGLPGRIEASFMLNATTQVKILVPGHHDMVRLLGARDELLKLIENAFETQIFVRGNEITLTGAPVETERVSRLFSEPLDLLERGHVLTSDAVGRSIQIIKDQEGGGPLPTEVLT